MVEFGDIGSRIFGGIVTGGFWIVFALIIAGVILAIGLYLRYIFKFNIKVEIKSLRSSGGGTEPIYKLIFDKGGFVDKKIGDAKITYFRLLKEKVDLPPPPFDLLQLGTGGKNYIKIFQKSDTEYYYLLPDRIDTSAIMIGDKVVPIAQSKMKIVTGSTAYWNLLRKKDNRKMFDTESLAMKLLPYIIPALMIVGVIFYTYIWLDKAPQIVSAGQKVAEEIAKAAAALDRCSPIVTTG